MNTPSRMARFEVALRGDAGDVARGIAVVLFPVLHGVLAVVLYDGEVGVDVVVILRVVFMIGGRHEQRVEIYALHAERREIIELALHALKIAAEKAAHVQICGEVVPVALALYVSAGVVVFVVGDVVGKIAVAESVDKYLIEHPALCPVGHVEAGNEGKVVLLLIVGDGARAVVEHQIVVVGDLEVIADLRHVGTDKFKPVVIEDVAVLRALLFHLAAAAADAYADLQDVVFEGAQSDDHAVARSWSIGVFVILGFVAE